MKKKIAYIFLVFCMNSFSQEIEYAKSVIARLSSPELKGRGYTGNGNSLAAEFILDEYKKMGLLSLEKSYLQPFKISINTFPGNLYFKIDDHVLTPAVDYLVESSSPGLKGKFPIVKIRREDIDSEKKLLMLTGKADNQFILIDNTLKYGETKQSTEQIEKSISRLKYDPGFYCKGVVIYSKDKLTWENASFQAARPVIIINKDLDLDQVYSLEINIESKFIKQYKTQNVAGYIKGTLRADSFIVVTAHYDHLGQMGKDVYFPGANDNASGVAMLLNLANYYSIHPPKYSMLFLSLSGEEMGLLGAKKFVDDPLIKLNQIKFLVNFDLAGTGEEGIKVVNGSVYKEQFELLRKINSQNNLLPKIDVRGEACISDHCMFYKKGVPCFYIYTQGGIRAYHDIYDKAETLPLTEFVDYCTLMIKFFDALL